MMKTAFTLITCDVGTEGRIVENLKTIDGIKEVQRVMGNYDIIVKLEAQTKEDLMKIITQKIRIIPNIRSTLSLIKNEIET